MKNLLIFILFAIVSSATLYGQITITKTIPQITEKSAPAPYDSTKNSPRISNICSYKGQLLYVNGLPEYKREIGYRHFYKTKEVNIFNVYKSDDYISTKYEALFGKYFYVRDVEELTNIEWLFHLQNRDDPDDWCYYLFNINSSEYDFPFITISYYNWLKRKIGTKIMSSYKFQKHDLYTGKLLSFNESDYWEIVDVTILDNSYELVFVLTNNRGNTTTINVQHKIMTIDEYQNLIKKYDKNMVDAARKGQIEIGMPEALLILSWGLPDRINEASYGDQFVYGDTYVYIKNGIITAWN